MSDASRDDLGDLGLRNDDPIAGPDFVREVGDREMAHRLTLDEQAHALRHAQPDFARGHDR